MNRDDIDALNETITLLHNRLLEVEGRFLALHQVTARQSLLIQGLNEEMKEVWDATIDQMVLAYRASLDGADENTTRVFNAAIETLETQRSRVVDEPAPFTLIQGGLED
ncbi:hypothetical protein D8666_22625 [Ochrobactrum soli]|uniref:hypothetical protein n=1 Tax=Ochrobactrum soli TaxID=2448455 RepID=UPI000EF1A2C8|nr:hypothetical protein [[Ochrobactrum] soli]RLL64605.1 hypothetical protein D8666_22625 [[Ochrobactrum] soli]